MSQGDSARLVGKTSREVRFVNMRNQLSRPVEGGGGRLGTNDSMLRFRGKVTMNQVTMYIYGLVCQYHYVDDNL